MRGRDIAGALRLAMCHAPKEYRPGPLKVGPERATRSNRWAVGGTAYLVREAAYSWAMSDLAKRQARAAAVVADNLELLARHLREHPHKLRGLNIRRDISPPGGPGDIYIEETEYLVRVFGAPDITVSGAACDPTAGLAVNTAGSVSFDPVYRKDQ